MERWGRIDFLSYLCRGSLIKSMNINSLIQKYFADCSWKTTIDVFDSKNIFDVYKRIVEVLNHQPAIELSVLQGLSYCFYEILDNVLTHSGKQCGTVLTCYLKEKATIRILVADDGIGVRNSLIANTQYANITEQEALILCIKNGVTDGKGMGFGLYSTLRLINSVGIRFEIVSGNHSLKRTINGVEVTKNTNEWQGTLVYVEISADKEINPNDIVENRTDCETEYNDLFFSDDDLDNLW